MEGDLGFDMESSIPAESSDTLDIAVCKDKYVRLNVGGSLFYTTVGTLTKMDTMLRAMFSGRIEVKTDSEGWVLIDRSGKHFETILNYLRDGSVPLPTSWHSLSELLQEAKFYCIELLVKEVEESLLRLQEKENDFRHKILLIRDDVDQNMIHSTSKPVVKLTMNRYNNVFSYTSNSYDNLLRHVEQLEKYALWFGDSVVFLKDVRDKSGQNEICQWSFYLNGELLKSVCCTSIHYSADKRQIKVESPDGKINEEFLNLLACAANVGNAGPRAPPVAAVRHCPSPILSGDGEEDSGGLPMPGQLVGGGSGPGSARGGYSVGYGASARRALQGVAAGGSLPPGLGAGSAAMGGGGGGSGSGGGGGGGGGSSSRR